MILSGLTQGERKVLDGVMGMSLASAPDIAGAQRRTARGVYARLRALRNDGLIEPVTLGWLRPRVDRWALTTVAREELGMEITGCHQPGFLARLVERIPALEWGYPAAAAVQGLGEMRDFHWVDDAAFDAAVRYECGWVVIMCGSECSVPKRLWGKGSDSWAMISAPWPSGIPNPRPSQVCCVVPDRWQAELVIRVVRRYEMTDWVSVWCISDDTWFGARESLQSRGWVHQPAYRRNMSPEAWTRRVLASPWSEEGNTDAAALIRRITPAIRSAMGGQEAEASLRRARPAIQAAATPREAAEMLKAVSESLDMESGAAGIISRLAAFLADPPPAQDSARLLIAVAEWPGIPTGMARAVLRETATGRRAQRGLALLTDLGLVRRWRDGRNNRYRLTALGMKLLADMDRVNPDSAWTRIQMDRWDAGGDFEEHEYGLLEVATDFIEAGCPVAAGWRDWESMGYTGGIDPDAQVLVGGVWRYLEYERSATSISAIRRKLRGYDSPLRVNDWPVLAVCRNDRAERNFQQVGAEMGIALLTTTIQRRRKHGAVGNLGCWSRFGEPELFG